MAGVGSPTRLSYGAVAAGVGGVLLIISLFIDWVGSDGVGGNAWQLFSITDIVLLVLGALAVGFAVLEITRAVVALPVDRARALTVVGIITTTLVWEVIFESDGQKFGMILAGLSALAILAGGLLAERAPELSLALGGGGGLGGQGGIGGQGGGYTQPPAAGGFEQPRVAGGLDQPPPAGGFGQAAPAGGALAPQPDTAVHGAPSAQPVSEPAPAVESPPPPPGGAADWYADPRGEKRLRYWDGTQWTHHVAD